MQILPDITCHQGDYCISTLRERLDVTAIHHYLSTESYWCPGVPFETVAMAISNSLNFGLYHDGKQVGLARVVSDFATVAYLGDVYVLPEHRGQGLSKWLMATIIAHPNLQGLRRWILLTRDAHDLYAQYGWQPLASPERWMERHNRDVYRY
jgi:GNAT superfamily N-acetyltransferase